MDLVLPCSTIVLTDTLVLPTDGANCKNTILMAQSLLVKSWLKKSHTMNLFVECGLKNLVSVSLNGLLHGLRKHRKKNEKDGREERSLFSDQARNFIPRHILIQ